MFRMDKKGFTLVELLVVLAILGLLAGIGIPQYMNTLERSRQAADKAIIATVQSAVDGYLSETGLKANEVSVGTPPSGKAFGPLLTGTDTLDPNAAGNSVLTGTFIEFKDFLENAALPTKNSFKSKEYGGGTGVNWKIDAQGKVSVVKATT